MDFKNRHPLNAIDGYESLSMLEALIPFVDYSLKLPLALFLKFSETRLIIQCFQSNNNLIRLGLHHPCNDPLDMICAFTGMSPDVLKMMFSMMDGGNSMVTNLFNSSPDMHSCDSGNDTRSFGPNFGFSPEDISKAMNMFQSMQSGFDNHQTNDTDPYPCQESEAHHPDDFEYNIQQLFAEYDLAQAEDYDNDEVYSDFEFTDTKNNSHSHYDD